MAPQTRVDLEGGFIDKKFSKGDFMLQPLQVSTSHLLIKEGVARKFYKYKNREITTEIYFHDDVAVSLDSYIMQKPGEVYIEALTDLEVTVIDYRRFQQAKNKYPDVMMLDKMFIEYYAVWFEERLRDFQTMDASERYLNLLEKDARVVQQVPLTIIASYLNVSLETLSRIRSKISLR